MDAYNRKAYRMLARILDESGLTLNTKYDVARKLNLSIDEVEAAQVALEGDRRLVEFLKPSLDADAKRYR